MPDDANVLVKVVGIFGVINRVTATAPAHSVFCYPQAAYIVTRWKLWLSGLNRASNIHVGLEPGSGL